MNLNLSIEGEEVLSLALEILLGQRVVKNPVRLTPEQRDAAQSILETLQHDLDLREKAVGR